MQADLYFRILYPNEVKNQGWREKSDKLGRSERAVLRSQAHLFKSSPTAGFGCMNDIKTG